MRVGTTVKIRENLVDGQKVGQFTFRSYMEKYRGKYAKITRITEPLRGEKMQEILLDIDGGLNYWDITMFAEFIDCDDKKEDKKINIYKSIKGGNACNVIRNFYRRIVNYKH